MKILWIMTGMFLTVAAFAIIFTTGKTFFEGFIALFISLTLFFSAAQMMVLGIVPQKK